MARKLKKAAIKRRFATHYYADQNTHRAYISQGAATSPEGAVRATVVRVFMGQYGSAVIFDRVLEAALITIKRGPHGLQAHYHDDKLVEMPRQLRRVK